MHPKIFKDRKQAGQELAKRLIKYAKEDPIILVLPRGGVPIGLEIAKVLHAPLDIIIVRKLSFPGNPEFGVGAIAEGDTKVFDPNLLSLMGFSEKDLEESIKEEKIEMDRRLNLYRNNKPLPNLRGRSVILVDDGLATGVTAKAAIEAVRKLNPKKILFASPVCAKGTAFEIASLIDDVICLVVPFNLEAIGHWYEKFDQLSDQEVLDLLKKQPLNFEKSIK